jgi:hypothetical protein
MKRPTALTVVLGVVLLSAGCTGAPPGSINQVGPAVGESIEAEVGWEPQLSLRKWDWIVVHHSATLVGSAASFHRGHQRRGWEGLGYHFVIGNGSETRDGMVEVGYRWTRQLTGAHVGGDNNIGKIGICLVGNFDNERPSAKQLASLAKLVRYLQTRHGVPSWRVVGHRDVVAAGYTHCPGAQFPMKELHAAIFDQPPYFDPQRIVIRY